MMPSKHKLDRDHKKKRKKRSRSRSPSRSRSRSPQDRNKRRRDERESSPRNANLSSPTGDGAATGGGDISLSIQETNKLRAQLGLKPLEVESKSEEKKEEKPFVHVPAKSMSEARRAEQQRDRVAAAKDRRRIQDKLSRVRGLGDSSDDDDGAMSWVQKSRMLERDEARRRARQLQAMDEEAEEEGRRDRDVYNARALDGLKVEHDVSRFKEGKSIILTLKDRGVLDDGDGDDEGNVNDVLVNPNLMDDERADKNIENKKGGGGYKPYEEAEVWDDNLGALSQRDILYKYDAEIHGESKASFKLGTDGRYDAEHERAMERLRQEMKSGQQSLSTSEPALARDYFTAEEMAAKAKFRKRKRRAGGVRKQQALTADDLLITATTEGAGGGDHGSRSRRGEAVKEETRRERLEAKEEPKEEKSELKEETMQETMEAGDDLLSGLWVPDAAADELEEELKKVRSLRHRGSRGQRRQEMLESLLETEEAGMEAVATPGGEEVILHDTAEFCRTLGDLPSLGLLPGAAANPQGEAEAEAAEVEEEWRVERQRRAAAERVAGGWQEVVPAGSDDEEEMETDSRPTSSRARSQRNAVLEEEPQLATGGVAAAITLAGQKGYLETESKKRAPDTKVYELRAQHFVQEQVRYDDIEAKFSKRDRFAAGPVSEFREKSTYQPNVKLDYVDVSGRNLNAKEAFRELSHRFHGKGSGKKKTEKKMKRIKEELLLKAMSSSDTPLGSVDKLHRKLETRGVPYVVLSGKNANASSLTK